jgi:hypothetical protein
MNSIVRFIPKTDMRNQHDGLAAVAKSHGIDLKKLEPGEHVVFANNAMNKLKLYSGFKRTDGEGDSIGVLSYVRADKGRLDLGLIEQIPQCFDARSGINWDKAAKLSLEKQLSRRSFHHRGGITGLSRQKKVIRKLVQSRIERRT